MKCMKLARKNHYNYNYYGDYSNVLRASLYDIVKVIILYLRRVWNKMTDCTVKLKSFSAGIV